jgi:glycerate kinase
MKKRILIAPNSFKECADSVTVAELIKSNLSSLKNAELISKPISDGGDGFLTVCNYYFGGEIKKYLISTPYNDSIFECTVLVNNEQKSIYVESAEVLGLKRVPISKRNPLLLSSKGLGELLLKINEDIIQGIIMADRIFIGIGGTATIDMGLGMMNQLGLVLYDSEGKELVVLPYYFRETTKVKYKPITLSFSIHPVIDVSNKLFGKDGGISVFGKQKGADEVSIKLLEENFNHIYNLIKNNDLLIPFNELSGAGGGLPAALQIFFNSRLIHSENFIFGHLNLDSNITDTD